MPERGHRWGLALVLLVLSPICAEYLVGYDSSTGRPLQLLSGLVIFVPLYGAPALLIRETARRLGIGWPGIVALAAAAGILQAGVWDQSLFSTSYRDIDYWEQRTFPTYVAPLGLSAYNAVNFVGGHVVWSFSLPILLTERLSPSQADRPWLRRRVLVLLALLYAAAAALILSEQARTETDHASAAQLLAALAVAAVLVGLALAFGRSQSTGGNGPAPSPPLVLVGSFVTALAVNLAPETWTGVTTALLVLVVAGWTVLRLSRSRRWGDRQLVALATGALVARAAIGFLVVPLGEVALAAKYGHNAACVLGAGVLGLVAYRRGREVPDDRSADDLHLGSGHGSDADRRQPDGQGAP